MNDVTMVGFLYLFLFQFGDANIASLAFSRPIACH